MTEADPDQEAQAAMLNMYVLKFNTPILPYAKFPQTHSR